MLAIALVALAVPLVKAQRARITEAEEAQMMGRTALAAAMVSDVLHLPENRQPKRMQHIAVVTLESLRSELGADAQLRVVVVDREGHLVADSSQPRAPAGVQGFPRPEITSALEGKRVQVRRRSKNLGAEVRMTATPVLDAGSVSGAVRVTQSMAAIDRQLAGRAGDPLKLPLIIGAAVALMGLGAALFLARRLVRPVQALEETVQRVTTGELTARAAVSGSREQQHVARAFNQMTERFEALLDSQQQFVANASHQLKTPLTALRLRLEALRKRVARDGHAVRHVDEATRAVDGLNDIVDDLLILSRHGESAATPAAIDLNVVVCGVAERWRPAAEHAGVKLRVSVHDGECRVVCASSDLEHALDALVENALAYTPSGFAVELRTEPCGVEVVDQGPGLALGEEEIVFERFRRGQAGQNGPHGSGLGLPIARELVERWGGTVTISNGVPHGAIARLSLPAGFREEAKVLHSLDLQRGGT